MSLIYLAWQSIRHEWLKNLIFVIAVVLIAGVPLLTRSLVSAIEADLTARAEGTPLVLGLRGSATDLVMSSLYFDGQSPEAATLSLSEDVWDTGYADAIPLYLRFQSQGVPILGTSLDYADFRGLALASGKEFSRLGEAVLGAKAAQTLGLAVGDTLITTPENLFDLAGTYPLELEIVGIYAPSASPDDGLIFVDLKTSWIIEGLGHGHDDVIGLGESLDGVAIANARQKQFTRITDENRYSFHFHGSLNDYPITSVIALPFDHKSETILRGLYLDAAQPYQVTRPAHVVRGLIDTLLQIQALLDLMVALVGSAASVGLGLALFLSIKARQPELKTNWRLGAPAWFNTSLVLTEVLLLILVAGLVAFFTSRALHASLSDLVLRFIA